MAESGKGEKPKIIVDVQGIKVKVLSATHPVVDGKGNPLKQA